MQEDTYQTADLKRYAAMLWRWAWLLALAALLAGAAAYAAVKRAIPIYESSATIMIDESEKTGESEYQSLLLSERRVGSYAHLLRSDQLLREVTSRLKLAFDDTELARLSRGVTVEPVRDTQLIRLSVRHADPQIAAAVVNEIPRVFEAQNRARLTARFASTRQSLLQELAVLEGEITASQAVLDVERAKPQRDEAAVTRLEAMVNQHRATYEGLLESLREVRLAEAMETRGLLVVEPAEVPKQPIPSGAITKGMLAGLSAAMLTAGLVLIIEYIDDTVKGPEDLEAAVRLPALASIGRFAMRESAGGSPLVAVEPDSADSEAYRVLRTNLEFSLPDQEGGGTILLVTSAKSGEGKTATVANLGAILAQSRKEVLLVDADLRRPSLHLCFGRRNRRGLTSLIYRVGLDPESVVQRTSLPGLRLLSAGRIPVNPAETLGFPETAALLERLRSMADYVIVDSPPALSVADAAVLAKQAHGVVLVAEAGKTRRNMLRQLVAVLQGAHAPILGVVMNKVRRGRTGYYGDAYYARGKGRRERGVRARVARGLLQLLGVSAVAGGAESEPSARSLDAPS